MCKIGDILLIYDAKVNGKRVGPHQFIVLNDEFGEIQGMSYDVLATILSSMTTEKKQAKYERFPGNLSIMPDDRNVINDNNAPAFTKLDQFFYFSLKTMKYKVIGTINDDIMDLIYDYISELQAKGIKFYNITENLTHHQTGEEGRSR